VGSLLGLRKGENGADCHQIHHFFADFLTIILIESMSSIGLLFTSAQFWRKIRAIDAGDRHSDGNLCVRVHRKVHCEAAADGGGR